MEREDSWPRLQISATRPCPKFSPLLHKNLSRLGRSKGYIPSPGPSVPYSYDAALARWRIITSQWPLVWELPPVYSIYLMQSHMYAITTREEALYTAVVPKLFRFTAPLVYHDFSTAREVRT
jgi:hypothetical protein